MNQENQIDHRNIGQELDLFYFDELAPPRPNTFIRTTKHISGFRASKIYTALFVPKNSFCLVTKAAGLPGSIPAFGIFEACVLKYVKKRKRWERTKVLVNITYGNTVGYDGWKPEKLKTQGK